jgi:hypothetical protein
MCVQMKCTHKQLQHACACVSCVCSCVLGTRIVCNIDNLRMPVCAGHAAPEILEPLADRFKRLSYEELQVRLFGGAQSEPRHV